MAVHRSLNLRLFLAMFLALLLALAATNGGPAHAATFTVTKTADTADGTCDADCSLREAIIAANAAAGADTVSLPAGTHTLAIAGAGEDAAATGDVDITDDLSINGAGAASTTVDGGGIDRVFEIVGAVALDIAGTTIQNGSTGGDGGGISGSSGTLTLTDSIVSGNTAGVDGGGVSNISGSLTFTSSIISGNSAGRDGGGVRNSSGTLIFTNATISGNTATAGNGGGVTTSSATLTFTNSTLSGNTAGTIGGGIFNGDGTLTIMDTTVSGNSASDRGGGIYNSSGTTTVTDSTISGNSSSGFGGGGLYDEIGNVTLTNVTVSGNTTTGNGGGAYDENGTTAMTNVTVTGNSASSGGGVFVEIGTVTIQNAIVANSASGGDCAGTSPITSNGYTLDSDGTCNLTEPTDLPNTDPLLGPLADHGGPTLTHALLVVGFGIPVPPAASPALDAIPPGASGCGMDAATDQRGVPRPQEAGCDIGAYERIATGVFADVPDGYFAQPSIEALVAAGVTAGCSTSPPLYCPESSVTREQMAIFLLRGMGVTPPPCTTAPFPDVPCSSPFAASIAELVNRGITAGCGGGLYCPTSPVTREQMAIFLLRAIGVTPPACTTPTFGDVACSSVFADWIEELVSRGITAGCSVTPALYCPADPVTRAQMAVFLVNTFNLPF